MLVPGSVVFSSDGQPAGAKAGTDNRSLSTAQGGYTFNADGSMQFTPATGFHGVTDPVRYTVADSAGEAASAAVVVTVHAAPTASDDDGPAPSLDGASYDVLSDDTADPDAPLDPSTLRFADVQPAGVTVDGAYASTVAGGTYHLEAEGTVSYRPEGDGPGTVAGVRYQVSDADGRTATAVLRPKVVAQGIWTDTATRVTAGVPATVPVLAGAAYTDGRQPDPAGLTFSDTDQPDDGVLSPDHRVLTMPGRLTVTLDPVTGAMAVLGAPGYSGDVGVTLRLTGADAAPMTLSWLIDTYAPAVATDDHARTLAGRAVTTDVLADDTADAAWPSSGWTLGLATSGQPSGSTSGVDGTGLVVPGEGRYAISGSTITFTPADGFAGETTPVRYTLDDGFSPTATAAFGVTVVPPPTGTDDSAFTPYGQPVTLDVLGNDALADHRPDTSTLRFPATGQPATAVVGADGSTLSVPGQASYAISLGRVVVTPAVGFTGSPAPVTYAIDTADGTATARVQVAVGVAPHAVDDTGTAHENMALTVPVLANDTADTRTPLQPRSVGWAAAALQPGTAVLGGTRITVPGQGSYDLVGDGTVSFTPVTGFSGAATPVVYQVADSAGATSTAAVRLTVLRAVHATDDSLTVLGAQTAAVSVLANDSTDTSTRLDPASVVFAAAGQPAGAVRAADGRTLSTADGTWTSDGAGVVRFSPRTGFRGTAAPVVYTVADGLGQTGSASVTVTVRALTAVQNDAATTVLTAPVVVDVLANDTADPATPMVPTSLLFPATGQPSTAKITAAGHTLTVSGQGTYVIGSDSRVTFSAVSGYVGTTSPIRYQVSDSAGTVVSATLTVRVIDTITAVADKASTAWGTAVVVKVLANDTAKTALLPGTLLFGSLGQPTGAVLSGDARTLTVPGEATYQIDAVAGKVIVTPLRSVSGRTLSPVRYGVADTSGASTSAGVLTVTVGAASGAIARADTATTSAGKPITVAVLSNDHASPGVGLVAGSVVFTDTTKPVTRTRSADGKRIDVAGQGTYTVNANGAVLFTPATGFKGTATPVGYSVVDGNGLLQTSTITVSVR